MRRWKRHNFTAGAYCSNDPAPWNVIERPDAHGVVWWWLRRHALTWARVRPCDVPPDTTAAQWAEAKVRHFEGLHMAFEATAPARPREVSE